MSSINWDAIISDLKNGVSTLAASTVNDYLAAAKTDGCQLVDSLKNDMQTWAQQLATGQLSKDDVEFLILAKKDLIAMNALKQTGLALAKVDAFKAGVLNLIVGALCKLI